MAGKRLVDVYPHHPRWDARAWAPRRKERAPLCHAVRARDARGKSRDIGAVPLHVSTLRMGYGGVRQLPTELHQTDAYLPIAAAGDAGEEVVRLCREADAWRLLVRADRNDRVELVPYQVPGWFVRAVPPVAATTAPDGAHDVKSAAPASGNWVVAPVGGRDTIDVENFTWLVRVGGTSVYQIIFFPCSEQWVNRQIRALEALFGWPPLHAELMLRRIPQHAGDDPDAVTMLMRYGALWSTIPYLPARMALRFWPARWWGVTTEELRRPPPHSDLICEHNVVMLRDYCSDVMVRQREQPARKPPRLLCDPFTGALFYCPMERDHYRLVYPTVRPHLDQETQRLTRLDVDVKDVQYAGPPITPQAQERLDRLHQHDLRTPLRWYRAKDT